jgi:hypothetical protein
MLPMTVPMTCELAMVESMAMAVKRAVNAVAVSLAALCESGPAGDGQATKQNGRCQANDDFSHWRLLNP